VISLLASFNSEKYLAYLCQRISTAC